MTPCQKLRIQVHPGRILLIAAGAWLMPACSVVGLRAESTSTPPTAVHPERRTAASPAATIVHPVLLPIFQCIVLSRLTN